jgi:hypothetical protein
VFPPDAERTVTAPILLVTGTRDFTIDKRGYQSPPNPALEGEGFAALRQRRNAASIQTDPQQPISGPDRIGSVKRTVRLGVSISSMISADFGWQWFHRTLSRPRPKCRKRPRLVFLPCRDTLDSASARTLPDLDAAGA